MQRAIFGVIFMKRFFVLLTFIIALPSEARAQAPFRGTGGDGDAVKHGWLSSLEAGKAEARKSGKPLMVVLRCVP
jgi:hypothetical protein